MRNAQNYFSLSADLPRKIGRSIIYTPRLIESFELAHVHRTEQQYGYVLIVSFNIKDFGVFEMVQQIRCKV